MDRWTAMAGSCMNGYGEEWVGVRTRVTLLQWRHVVGSAARIDGAPAPRASALSARPARPTMVLGWAIGAKPWVALGPLTVGAKPWVALGPLTVGWVLILFKLI
jgi:hypothetical protein